MCHYGWLVCVLFLSTSLTLELFPVIANTDMIIANFIPVSKVQTCTEDSLGGPKEVDLCLNVAKYPLHNTHKKYRDVHVYI
jgi:hypothetical protein